MTYEALVRAHLIFGSIALVTFWVQMLRRKGGVGHRRIGLVYSAAMAMVVLTAIPITVNLARGQALGAGLFLGFLGWITVSAGVAALMAARWRNEHLTRQFVICRALSWGILLISLGLLAYSFRAGVLFLALGGFGTWAAISDLRTPIDAPVWRSWLARHLESMIGTGIAVHVAFFAFGLRGLLGGSYGTLYFVLSFVVPIVVGTWAASRLSARVAASGSAAVATDGSTSAAPPQAA